MSVYFTIYTCFLFTFYSVEIFINTCANNRKRDFWGPYTWPLDLHQFFFPIGSEFFYGMLHVTTHADVWSSASRNPWIISKSDIRVFTRKGSHCECGVVRNASQSVDSGHQYITSSYPIRCWEGVTGEVCHCECGSNRAAVKLTAWGDLSIISDLHK